jgi:hypothetical protein
MSTLQTVVDDARVLLNDSAKLRYSDALLLKYANEAIAYAKRIRPDLFLGTFKTTLSAYGLTDSTPLPPEYEFALKDYVVARSNTIDDEYSIDGRAGAFNQNFKTVLMTI